MFHGSIGFLSMDSIKKIEGASDAPIVTLVGERYVLSGLLMGSDLKLEFPSMEAKNEFYTCFPLLKEGIEIALCVCFK